MILKSTYLEKLKTEELLTLSNFIVKENFKHHLGAILPSKYEEEIILIFEEEISFNKNAEIFVYKDYLGSIIGSIRILKWDYIDVLPIQKNFNINPFSVIGDISLKNVWHIGRFAIKKEVSDISLFKKLIICAITPVCQHKDNIAFAECDSKLLRMLKLLGIKTTIIGKSINYLGSKTIPISMNYDGLISFYEKNKNLISNDILISKISKINKNYSFV